MIEPAVEKDPYADCPEHWRRVRLPDSLEFVFVFRVRARSEFSITFSRTRSRGFRL
jgi:hypothetical protein